MLKALFPRSQENLAAYYRWVLFLFITVLAVFRIHLVVLNYNEHVPVLDNFSGPMQGFLLQDIPLYVLFLAAIQLLNRSIALTLMRQALAAVTVILVSALVLLSLLSHMFYYKTGEYGLGLRLLEYVIENFAMLWPIFSGSIELSTILVSVCAFVIVIVLAVSVYIYFPWAFRVQTSGHVQVTVLVLASASVFLGSLQSWHPTAAKPSDSYIAFFFRSILQDDSDSIGSKGLGYSRDGQLEPIAEVDAKNLVFIVLESTRADYSIENYKGFNASPYLRTLSKTGLSTKAHYTIVPHTSKALVSILCGVEPYLDMNTIEALPDRLPVRCLPELLGRQNYRTAFFQTAVRKFEERFSLVEYMGVDDFFGLEDLDLNGFQEVNYFGYEDNAVLNKSRDWVAEAQSGPFFATYLTLTPHEGYNVPSHSKFRHLADRVENLEDKSLSKYLKTLAYQDNFIQRLLDQYKQLGLFDRTVFVLVGDHGEGFGEHGRRIHDNVIYNEGLRVPMVMINATDKADVGFNHLDSNHLDLLKTASHAIGFDVIGGGYPGRNLFVDHRNSEFFAQCWQANACISLIRGPYKYIHHYDYFADELYRIDDDPLEKYNLVTEHPELARSMKSRVTEWKDGVDSTYEQLNRKR